MLQQFETKTERTDVNFGALSAKMPTAGGPSRRTTTMKTFVWKLI